MFTPPYSLWGGVHSESNPMTIDTFEKELHGIDPHITIKKSPTPGLAGVYWRDEYLFAIPDHNIYDDINETYAIEMPSGKMMRHRTRHEAIGMAKILIHRIKTDPDYGDATMGVGKYSNQSLGIK